MKILRKIIRIEPDKYKEYNLDDSFFNRPIDILVGIKNCKVETFPIPGQETYLHLHLCLIAPSVGEGLSFQGMIGQKDFRHSVCTRRNIFRIKPEENDRIRMEGINTKDVEMSEKV